ncbi:hypothetical protein CANARDRAFT_234167 [[Candida] arabinofermentans NRRL YB-2248]|uniref:STAS domain-containing protein n=1 Tax=[Candida] arabinofermentans NRRL YB-2248 TaxID=983967 RepID=A0A1E4T096_9ASCO|nr:hypothetical protein CANARDRAFT_234167 [[Candida] arabinofermentans NRRL YB-2248]
MSDIEYSNNGNSISSPVLKKQSTYNEITQVKSDSAPVQVEENTEPVITVKDYFTNLTDSPKHTVFNYAKSLFPITGWITHYPFTFPWVYGDFVAGVTVAIVLVPQSMSYAQLAGLSSEYGLYSSFVGVLIYALFATSKDVSIGPVAVMSMEVGKIIARVQDKHGDLYSAPIIATTLTLLCGSIALGVGLLRLGFLVELISLPAVLAFMSGSAFNIMVGQVPGLMGFNKKVNTREAPYKVVINTLKNLKHTKVDAAFGLVSLFILYTWKFTTSYLYRRYPKQRVFFYLEQIRTAIVIIFATVISWAIIRHDKTHSAFSVNGKVPSGLRHVGAMTLPNGLVSDIASELPVATIILVLEHISISKSFGRINDYKINPNQELIAIGVTNLVGTFFNAYPATGSFSRTALKSKCGVRTPFAGVFTGACVLLSIYCFTDAFYYIPKATLCAIIIHAVSDLIASYKITWNLWRVQPLDCAIFFIGLIITVFSTIENGIYFCMAASAALILWRICIPNGAFLGRINVSEVVDPRIITSTSSSADEIDNSFDSGKATNDQVSFPSTSITKSYYRWVPIPTNPLNSKFIHTQYINNKIDIRPPPPGVIVFRPSESFVYPNSSRQVDLVLDEIKRVTRPAHIKKTKTFNNPGVLENPWWRKKDIVYDEEHETRPHLKIVHFDFSQVMALDTTAMQSLIDLKNAIGYYSGNDFEIHFSGIINPWVKRGLINAGFGELKQAKVPTQRTFDLEHHVVTVASNEGSSNGYYAITDTNYPCFHLDVPSFDYLDPK